MVWIIMDILWSMHQSASKNFMNNIVLLLKHKHKHLNYKVINTECLCSLTRTIIPAHLRTLQSCCYTLICHRFWLHQKHSVDSQTHLKWLTLIWAHLCKSTCIYIPMTLSPMPRVGSFKLIHISVFNILI